MQVRSKVAGPRSADGIEWNDVAQRDPDLTCRRNGTFQYIRMSDKNRCFGRGKLIGEFFGGVGRVCAASWQIPSRYDVGRAIEVPRT